jgi:hypothetical protein
MVPTNNLYPIFILGYVKQELSNSMDEDLDIIGIILRRIYDFDPLVKIFAPFFERK